MASIVCPEMLHKRVNIPKYGYRAPLLSATVYAAIATCRPISDWWHFLAKDMRFGKEGPVVSDARFLMDADAMVKEAGWFVERSGAGDAGCLHHCGWKVIGEEVRGPLKIAFGTAPEEDLRKHPRRPLLGTHRFPHSCLHSPCAFAEAGKVVLFTG
ncbi:uncharacterized protein PADG_11059 [Paracoccidioides brasiliensis Pb18]|uniref:Uncharacterized protein n=1 Tax=Paracoccidioides brasiliensis (strain Pb18) TaxID=502780 RepID=A0A0A0HZ23_PARBD|nr:uncharacterized protein PADG_11059 [Paracoccidioides brasiliensis Pb18]KGM92610.1 hypothetical protein PADG_11059 [Paracoccidioides brasiliensis Pb18]